MATSVHGARVRRHYPRPAGRAAATLRPIARAVAPVLVLTMLFTVIVLTAWTAEHAPLLAVPVILAVVIAAVVPWPPSWRTVSVSSVAVLAVALGCAALAVAS